MDSSNEKNTQLILARGNPWMPVINFRTHIRLGESYEKKKMKTMIFILYGLTYTGILLEVTDIVPGVPDRITVAVIVGGLVAANLMQWRQAIKDREDFRNRMIEQTKIHKDEIKEMNANLMTMVNNNSKAIQEIFLSMRK